MNRMRPVGGKPYIDTRSELLVGRKILNDIRNYCEVIRKNQMVSRFFYRFVKSREY
jgi:hypothetical protein